MRRGSTATRKDLRKMKSEIKSWRIPEKKTKPKKKGNVKYKKTDYKPKTTPKHKINRKQARRAGVPVARMPNTRRRVHNARRKLNQKEKYLISLKREKEMATKGWKVARTQTYLEKPKRAIGKEGYPYATLNKNKTYETFYTWKEGTSKKKKK